LPDSGSVSHPQKRRSDSIATATDDFPLEAWGRRRHIHQGRH
jgi:hypothetical protein